VGFESGFQNLSHFHRVFKKTVDSTPLAYRQRFLNG
jgi:AraC-like DNA-binding protein